MSQRYQSTRKYKECIQGLKQHQKQIEKTNLIVDQIVKSNDAPDQRRQVYHQHHVICFHCTKEREN
jgi:hypothetical protein